MENDFTQLKGKMLSLPPLPLSVPHLETLQAIHDASQKYFVMGAVPKVVFDVKFPGGSYDSLMMQMPFNPLNN